MKFISVCSSTLALGKGRYQAKYLIPIKDRKYKKLPLEKIKYYVSNFLYYASKHPRLKFKVNKIGLSVRYYALDIAPMFRGSPPNVILPKRWRKLIVCPTCGRSYEKV